jgi:hypothetical protein
VYLMKSKDEAFSMFKRYKYEAKNKKEKKIKFLRIDRGGEHFPHKFPTFCEEHGIVHQKSASYTPQQNGLTERKNMTLVNMVNCMILSAKLHFNLWGETLLTTCHVHNRVSSIKMQVSPYKLWNDKKPNLNYLRVWECLAFYRVPDLKRTKLGLRAIKNVFVGYAENSKAYRLLDLSSNVIVESRDVKFIENKFNYDSKYVSEPSQTQVSDSYPSTSLINSKRLVTDLPIEQRKS